MYLQTHQLIELTTDHRGVYGIPASAVERKDELYTYLRITDIFEDGTLDYGNMKSLDDPNATKYLLRPNDIVFARTGASTGKNYFYDEEDGKLVYAGFLIRFNIDPQKVNPRFIRYYCLSQQYKDWVHMFTSGSTRGNINAQTFGNMEIPLPTRAQQDNLVRILGSIDKKIKINKRINDNLQGPNKLLQRWRWILVKILVLIAVMYRGKTRYTRSLIKKVESLYSRFIVLREYHNLRVCYYHYKTIVETSNSPDISFGSNVSRSLESF